MSDIIIKGYEDNIFRVSNPIPY